MKKIINRPENYVTEMLEGIYAAHPDQANREVFDVLWYEFMVPASK